MRRLETKLWRLHAVKNLKPLLLDDGVIYGLGIALDFLNAQR
jgi:hypothetical protein